VTLRTALVAAIVVVTNVLGNFCLSWGLKRYDPSGSFLRMFVNPWVVGGIGLLIAWTLTRMSLLSQADLSFVLPVTAVGYPLTAVMGRLFLNEQISAERWAGTLLILAGVVLVGGTNPRTT
jgi:uncharacterized membrane protein